MLTGTLLQFISRFFFPLFFSLTLASVLVAFRVSASQKKGSMELNLSCCTSKICQNRQNALTAARPSKNNTLFTRQKPPDHTGRRFYWKNSRVFESSSSGPFMHPALEHPPPPAPELLHVGNYVQLQGVNELINLRLTATLSVFAHSKSLLMWDCGHVGPSFPVGRRAHIPKRSCCQESAFSAPR